MKVASIPIAAASITKVAIHPINFRMGGSRKSPITARLLESNIMATITGTATTPLITALQNNALTGSIGVKFNTVPMTMATPIVA